jgi:HD superfamily phosphodiesterase
MFSVADARQLAEAKLAGPLPRRWRHVLSMARRAKWVAEQLPLVQDLEMAAWLHDIGYAPELVDTGFHPLDGARYLRSIGMKRQVVSLVAYGADMP